MQKINELRLLYITDQQLHSVSCYAQQCVDTFMYHALVIVAGSRGSTGESEMMFQTTLGHIFLVTSFRGTS